MTIIDSQHAFEQALRHDDEAFLLTTFLRLIVAVERGIHMQIEQIQALESADNPELYSETIHYLMTGDMLAYVSAASAQETAELRSLLDAVEPDKIMNWYHRQWSGRVATAADILVSIASALRSAMTFIYGNIYLLRHHLCLTTTQETACQYIIELVDMLRACRNQLRNRLSADGIKIQEF
jgi:hypothetical protein